MTLTFRRDDRAGGAVGSAPDAVLDLPAPRAPTPAGVKIMLVLVAINIFVAAIVLLKLRAPHLG